VVAFPTTAASPTDPNRVNPVIRRAGVIGTMEELTGRPIKVLALSGGGQYGAFGAGFLDGWTKSGTRPQFDLVNGISTGALLATHAFLGTAADDAVLKELYTSIDRRDIYRSDALGALFGGPALNKTNPMWALIQKVITPEVLERVAAEWDKNRRLLVAATNLWRSTRSRCAASSQRASASCAAPTPGRINCRPAIGSAPG
jgi:predicted acylesterase/phospholipase RssA